MRKGWAQDEWGFSRVAAEWLCMAVTPRNDGSSEWWAAEIDGQRLVDRGAERRFKDADEAMTAVEEEARGRCRQALEEI